MKRENKIQAKNQNEILLTRKQAIQKAGITALTAASLLFLNTKAMAVGSPASPGKPPNW